MTMYDYVMTYLLTSVPEHTTWWTASSRCSRSHESSADQPLVSSSSGLTSAPLCGLTGGCRSQSRAIVSNKVGSCHAHTGAEDVWSVAVTPGLGSEERGAELLLFRVSVNDKLAGVKTSLQN